MKSAIKEKQKTHGLFHFVPNSQRMTKNFNEKYYLNYLVSFLNGFWHMEIIEDIENSRMQSISYGAHQNVR